MSLGTPTPRYSSRFLNDVDSVWAPKLVRTPQETYADAKFAVESISDGFRAIGTLLTELRAKNNDFSQKPPSAILDRSGSM